MSTDAAAQIASRCSCGSPLRWETREGFGERRSLALCTSHDCGLITTASPGGVQPDQALAAHLLGPVPAQRYLAPWTRFYWKASRWGFRWCAAYENCTACSSELTTQLALPPLVERQSDPFLVAMCLTCGATSMAWWRSGERITIAIEGDDWNEPATAVLIVKRVLEERAARTCEGPTWDFLQ